MTTSATTSTSATSAAVVESRPEIVLDEKPARAHAGWTLAAAVGLAAVIGTVVWVTHPAATAASTSAAPSAAAVSVPDVAVGAMRGWEPRNLTSADAPSRGHMLVRTAVVEPRTTGTVGTGHGRVLLDS